MKTLIGLALLGFLGHTSLGAPNAESNTSEIVVPDSSQERLLDDQTEVVENDNKIENALIKKQNEQLAQIEILKRQMEALENNTEFILPTPNKEGLTTQASAEAESEMNSGIENLDMAVRLIPSVAISWLTSFEKHGLYAFVYDDPETKGVTENFGSTLGKALRDIAQATAKDMSRNTNT